MSSFIAAGSAYSTHGINTIPFFIYYSMFGMQRIGDLVWLAGDMRVKGFMVGGTAGRTTLNGEGPATRGRAQPPFWPIQYPISKPMIRPLATRSPSSSARGIRRMYVEQEGRFFII